MAATQFDGWLDWRLKQGSHDFPGPDGGTCINEAAVVVAGFAYREIATITDLPESFCPVISQFCLTLNDSMPEGDIINALRPFAIRLSGSADTRKVAYERALYLATCSVTRFAPLAIEATDPVAATKLRTAERPETALAILVELTAGGAWSNDAGKALGAAKRALRRVLEARQAVYVAELSAISAIRSAAVDAGAWDLAIDVIDAVLRIGRQADPVETYLIDKRATEGLVGAC